MMTSSQKPKNDISIFDPCQMYKKTAKFGGVWANTSEDRSEGEFTHSPPSQRTCQMPRTIGLTMFLAEDTAPCFTQLLVEKAFEIMGNTFSLYTRWTCNKAIRYYMQVELKAKGGPFLFDISS